MTETHVKKEKKKKKGNVFSFFKQRVQQEIKAHSNLAHGIIKANKNHLLLMGEFAVLQQGGGPRWLRDVQEMRQRRGRGSSCLL